MRTGADLQRPFGWGVAGYFPVPSPDAARSRYGSGASAAMSEKHDATRRQTMTMATRPLGISGLEISRVGFGSWAVGGGGWSFGWGPQDDAESLATMRHAIELGINWIDTAAVYGLGHSETMIGRLFRELPARDRPFIFTKCGLVWNETDRMAPPRRVLTPASIRHECEASLRRLGV